MFSRNCNYRTCSADDSLQEASPLHGLFANGYWMCDCEPRMKARRFQTMEGRPNNGRWFYTCPRPKAKGCNLLLWEDEAKAREVELATKIGFSGPLHSPPTPVKDPRAFNTTPSTTQRNNSRVGSFEVSSISGIPLNSSSNTQSSSFNIKTEPVEKDGDENEEAYDWVLGADEELSKALPSNLMSSLRVPRKALKTNLFSTPGKRNDGGEANPLQEDVFTTPTTPTTPTPIIPGLFSNYNLPSPADTPTPLRFKNSTGQHSDLATQFLQLFDRKKIQLSSHLKNEVRAIAEKHDRHLHGVFKGRDLSKAAIAEKSEEIMKLKEKVAALEAERQILMEFNAR